MAKASSNSGNNANKRRKTRRNVTVAVAHVQATFNNTTVTITDTKGDTLCWASAGTCGFKGSRKSTPFAGQVQLSKRLKGCQVRGQGDRSSSEGARQGRESAITALQTAGMTVKQIEDVTPIPHNGCRPRKRRRV